MAAEGQITSVVRVPAGSNKDILPPVFKLRQVVADGRKPVFKSEGRRESRIDSGPCIIEEALNARIANGGVTATAY